MYDLKQVYGELVQSLHVLHASDRAMQSEFRKRTQEAGYPEVAADFFLAIGGPDRSHSVLRDVYKLMCEHWLCEGCWLTTEEAQVTEAWTELQETADAMPDFN